MKEMARYGLILSVICMIAAGLLAGANSLTKPKIIAQAQAEEELSLKEVMPLAEHFKPLRSGDEVIYYEAYAAGEKLVGFVFKAAAGGYSSTIETLAAMSPDGTIIGIKVLSQNETPGLGSEVSKPDFTNRFKNKQGLSDIQAITGATISSKAVIDSVNKKREEIKGLIKK